MSKGREVVFTRALDDDEYTSVKTFSFQEMQVDQGAYNALQERDEDNSKDVAVEEASASKVVTAEQLESLQQQAYQEAHDKGFAEGRVAGVEQALSEQRQQSAEQARQVQAMLNNFSEPLQNLEDQVFDELVAMVITIAKHFVRRELKSDPGQIIAVTREVLAILPMNSRQVKLHLHPDDAVLVRDTLALSNGDSPWHVIDDGSLSRGGLKVISENSQIDATVESRFAEVIARVLGDERGSESE